MSTYNFNDEAITAILKAAKSGDANVTASQYDKTSIGIGQSATTQTQFFAPLMLNYNGIDWDDDSGEFQGYFTPEFRVGYESVASYGLSVVGNPVTHVTELQLGANDCPGSLKLMTNAGSAIIIPENSSDSVDGRFFYLPSNPNSGTLAVTDQLIENKATTTSSLGYKEYIFGENSYGELVKVEKDNFFDFLYGTTEPDASVGSEGDFYLQVV